MFEPLQAVNDMHQKGMEISLNIGNSPVAALHNVFLSVRRIHAGTNLLKLKEDFEREMKMPDHPSTCTAVLQMKQRVHYEGICILIGDNTDLPIDNASDASIFDHEPSFIMSKLMIYSYLGQYERAKHIYKRWESFSNKSESKVTVNFRNVYVSFYYGLSLIGLRRKSKVYCEL
jgi:hypothetical protein